MGKMINAILLILGIEAALWFFTGAGYGESSVFNLFLDPVAWLSNSWINALYAGITAVGLTAIVIGAMVIKQDWLWRAGFISTIFFSFAYVIVQFWNFLFSYLGAYAGEIQGKWLASIIAIPLLVYFIFTTLDFISGKD